MDIGDLEIAMNAPLNIVCYRWGTRYGVDYVNKLSRMVKRHLSHPHTFHCITDDATGLDKEIICHLLPSGHFKANWNKLMTFEENFLGLKGQFVVCLDVDLVIIDSIDFLCDEPEKDFMIARNWTDSAIRGNSSVYRLKVGSHSDVWNLFKSDVEKNIEEFHGKNRSFGDQQWMNHAIADYQYFPEGKIVSFKRHCGAKSWCIKLPLIGEITGASWGEATPPPKAAIVLFHGDPLPPDVAQSRHGRWRKAPFVMKNWH